MGVLATEKGKKLTQDELKEFNLTLFQPIHGYRYSLDPLLLTKFCPTLLAGGSIADLGAGCGVIGLVLARINQKASVVAIENNPEMAAIVEKNISYNELTSRVSVCFEDITNIRSVFTDSVFDLVVSNPPFRKSDSGRISPKAGRDAARHETTATMADFMIAAKYLVKPSGKICFIHLPERLQEFIATASELKLSLLRLKMIHNNQESSATMFMAELAKGRKSPPVVEPPYFVRDK